MSIYRRASLQQERLDYGRRRSSLSAPNHRRFSGSAISRSRINSINAADIHDTLTCHPPVEELCQLIPGLPDHISFEPTAIPPPAPPGCSPGPSTRSASKEKILESVQEQEEEEEEIERILNRTDPPTLDELHEALTTSLDKPTSCSSCSWRKVDGVNIINNTYCPAYRYTLETFSERRQLNWDFEPYTGDVLDDPSKGTVPNAWQISCSPCQQELFQNGSVACNVPHSDYVSTCLTCGGKGSKRCVVCSASGWDRCSFCLGAGYKIALHGYRDRCHECLGTGRKKCQRCIDGIAICRPCGGIGQIRYFLVLTVTWTNHIEEQVTKTEGISIRQEKLLLSPANKILEEESSKVHPISTFTKEVNGISSSVCERHKTLFEMEKVITQRQKLYEVPITQVSFSQDRRKVIRHCYIYGTDNSIYFSDEQASCCILL